MEQNAANARLPEAMVHYILRFLAGGIAVSSFAALADALRPKSFAGLFGAAPSIALATIFMTLTREGAPYVALEARSMVLGALAMAAYCWAVCLLLQRRRVPALTATLMALVVWFVAAFGASAILFGAT